MSIRALAARILLILVSVVLTVAVLEAGLSVTGLDARLIRSGLFYQEADLPVHRCSADPFLHYELNPGSRYTGYRRDGRRCTVSIDASGARGPAHPLQKAAGTFRILCFGGSTMYGAGVDDDETLPAVLETRLNHLPRGDAAAQHYEVWNFGTSAYTLGQATHLARAQLTALAPDLLLIQLHNVGRRPFLPVAPCDRVDVRAQPDGGYSFFLEQFPTPEWIDPELHFALLARSAIYRSLIAHTVRKGDGSPCDYCNALSQTEAQRLVEDANARDVPVVFIAIPADGGETRAADVVPGLPDARLIDLYRAGREPEFYEVHPPASILDEYAASLLEVLRQRGFLSKVDRTATVPSATHSRPLERGIVPTHAHV